MARATRRRREAWSGWNDGKGGLKEHPCEVLSLGESGGEHRNAAKQQRAAGIKPPGREDSGHLADLHGHNPRPLVRRVYAKDRGAAETFFVQQRLWIEGVLRELGAERFGDMVLRMVQSSFVRMAVRGLDGGDQTEGQLRRTIRSICEIQLEGVRLESGGFFKAYAAQDLDAAKEIFNGLHRVLRDGMVRKIRRNRAQAGEEDILQQVFFALWRNLNHFRLKASFRSMVDWIYTVLANQTAQWWREQGDCALGEGTARRLTRTILPDDAEFDWNDPEVVNAWLASAASEAARAVEEKYLEGADARDAEAGEIETEIDDEVEVDDLGRGGHDEAEAAAPVVESDLNADADRGLDVDDANDLGHGSYAASLRALEAWRRGVTAILEDPIDAVLAPLEPLVGRDVVRRVAGALQRLPAEQQNAFKAWLILRVVRSSNGQEIAAFLGVNHSTYRGWLRKARRAVAAALGHQPALADRDDGELEPLVGVAQEGDLCDAKA